MLLYLSPWKIILHLSYVYCIWQNILSSFNNYTPLYIHFNMAYFNINKIIIAWFKGNTTTSKWHQPFKFSVNNITSLSNENIILCQCRLMIEQLIVTGSTRTMENLMKFVMTVDQTINNLKRKAMSIIVLRCFASSGSRSIECHIPVLEAKPHSHHTEKPPLYWIQEWWLTHLIRGPEHGPNIYRSSAI